MIRLCASLLLLLSSLTANAGHQQHNDYQDSATAYRCYDVNETLIRGLWKHRDARLIERVGGTCDARGQDEGDVSALEAESLSEKDINKALRKARKRFPDLLYDAWLIGAEDVDGGSLKYIKYDLLYQKPGSNERIRVEVKQKFWSGKIKRMKAVVLTPQHKNHQGWNDYFENCSE